MDLADTHWDVVISGTGLAQSLLALALSRSSRNILHVDPNNYYGGPDASLSLDDAEAWAAAHGGDDALFSASSSLSPRAYALALAPQIIHARSALLAQLVSSRAFRQLEFLAVSFFVFTNELVRVPSTREDILSCSMPARSKRALARFLRFVLDHDAHRAAWLPHSHDALAGFLADFGLDADQIAGVLALTLSPDASISVADGLKMLHRHLTSTGVFAPGVAAVYPRWGASEIAQVACRAGAVGGAIYMLGAQVQVQVGQGTQVGQVGSVRVALSDVTLSTKLFVRGSDVRGSDAAGPRLRRLAAVIDSPMASLFEGSAVAVVAFRSLGDNPVHALVHSSDTGECPAGQTIIYASTLAAPSASNMLERAVALLAPNATVLCRLSYEQSRPASRRAHVDNGVVTLPAPSADLFFDDAALEAVREAWLAVGADGEYMTFEDREEYVESIIT